MLSFLILIIVLWSSKAGPYFSEINATIFGEDWAMMCVIYSHMVCKDCVFERENIEQMGQNVNY